LGSNDSGLYERSNPLKVFGQPIGDVHYAQGQAPFHTEINSPHYRGSRQDDESYKQPEHNGTGDVRDSDKGFEERHVRLLVWGSWFTR